MSKHNTAAALRELCQHEGRPWPEVIQRMAEQGYSWADVADYIGVPTPNIKRYCHYRNLHFPWQGNQSDIMREHQSRMMVGRPGPRGRFKRYTAFGVTDTLPRLALRFGETHGITYETLRRRVRDHDMSAETALSTPLMNRWGKTLYTNHCRKHPHGTTAAAA